MRQPTENAMDHHAMQQTPEQMTLERWEYLTKFCEARVSDKERRTFLKKQLEVRRPPVFTPESMIPELNSLGDDGWELVHMEPVARVGTNGDVLFDGTRSHWSNVYFCVFKRRKPSLPAPAPAALPSEPAVTVAQMADSQAAAPTPTLMPEDFPASQIPSPRDRPILLPEDGENTPGGEPFAALS